MTSREDANRAKASEALALVTVTVYMTPDEYERIRLDASWSGIDVNNYLVDYALGKTRGGC